MLDHMIKHTNNYSILWLVCFRDPCSVQTQMSWSDQKMAARDIATLECTKPDSPLQKSVMLMLIRLVMCDMFGAAPDHPAWNIP